MVLSFGINQDATFDAEMNSKYKCNVESFDPFVVNELFNKTEYENLLTINVNDKWRFHKIGITGDWKIVKLKQRIGWIAKLNDILAHTGLTNKIIDIFKMDIENGEWSVLINLDIDYACRYFKQIILETHTSKLDKRIFQQNGKFDPLQVLRKLEQCFLLFHRDTRFYLPGKVGTYGFYETEFQNHKHFRLSLEEFENEIELINFMVTYGELYFLNKNFLN